MTARASATSTPSTTNFSFLAFQPKSLSELPTGVLSFATIIEALCQKPEPPPPNTQSSFKRPPQTDISLDFPGADAFRSTLRQYKTSEATAPFELIRTTDLRLHASLGRLVEAEGGLKHDSQFELGPGGREGKLLVWKSRTDQRQPADSPRPAKRSRFDIPPVTLPGVPKTPVATSAATASLAASRSSATGPPMPHFTHPTAVMTDFVNQGSEIDPDFNFRYLAAYLRFVEEQDRKVFLVPWLNPAHQDHPERLGIPLDRMPLPVSKLPHMTPLSYMDVGRWLPGEKDEITRQLTGLRVLYRNNDLDLRCLAAARSHSAALQTYLRHWSRLIEVNRSIFKDGVVTSVDNLFCRVAWSLGQARAKPSSKVAKQIAELHRLGSDRDFRHRHFARILRETQSRVWL